MLNKTTIKERLKQGNTYERIMHSELIEHAEVSDVLNDVMKRMRENLSVFKGYTMPKHSSTGNVYEVDTNHDWTASFWCGMLWLAYEYTGDEVFKKQALVQCESFKERYEKNIGMDSHDIGFLYTLSCVAGYKLTGENWLKELALKAADALMTRYKEKGEYIQSWGDNGDSDFCMLIVDSLMNLPLLFWAGEITGDCRYTDAAKKHAMTCATNVIREDGSTYHTFYFNCETGEPVSGKTAQGYADDSTWARGQAWAIYGFSLAYQYAKTPYYLECAEVVCDYFLNHLKDDLLCYWDLLFSEPCDELLDSSASAIAACGMLNWMNLADDSERTELYKHAVSGILRSLHNKCSAYLEQDSNGLLQHGVYSIPDGLGVDECCIWGDYFYMEALVRLWKENNWNCYW